MIRLCSTGVSATSVIFCPVRRRPTKVETARKTRGYRPRNAARTPRLGLLSQASMNVFSGPPPSFANARLDHRDLHGQSRASRPASSENPLPPPSCRLVAIQPPSRRYRVKLVPQCFEGQWTRSGSRRMVPAFLLGGPAQRPEGWYCLVCPRRAPGPIYRATSLGRPLWISMREFYPRLPQEPHKQGLVLLTYRQDLP